MHRRKGRGRRTEWSSEVPACLSKIGRDEELTGRPGIREARSSPISGRQIEYVPSVPVFSVAIFRRPFLVGGNAVTDEHLPPLQKAQGWGTTCSECARFSRKGLANPACLSKDRRDEAPGRPAFGKPVRVPISGDKIEYVPSVPVFSVPVFSRA